MKRNLLAGSRQSGGFSLNVFSDDELYQIHLATLEILQNVGVFLEDQEALTRLGDAGASIDPKQKIAKISPYMVEDAIRSAPAKIVLAGRRPENDFVMENNRVGFTNFGEGIKIIDIDSGAIRETTKADVAMTARMVDAMSEIDVYERAVGAHDVNQAVAPLHNAEAFLANTTKHCFLGPISGHLVKKLTEMAAAVVGGADQLKDRPILSYITCPVSPLKLVQDTCEIIMEGAKSGLTVNILSMAMAGGSSPVNLAGTLANHNAEILAGIVLSQNTVKGAPVIYGSSSTAMDLKLGAASVGSPECGMISAAVARLGNYYGLPTWVAGG